MFYLENDEIKISIDPRGAELCNIFHKKKKLEYLWQAGSAWPKHSPVLFPIVGQLKNNTYRYNDKEYTLSRHGFARERDFIPESISNSRMLFRLTDDPDSMKVYPFHFNFDIEYQLLESGVDIRYAVVNTGNEALYFSVGAHPAFRIPLDIRDRYEDYFLEFSEPEELQRWHLKNGLIDHVPTPFLSGKKLALHKDLFKNDALVFKNPRSSAVELKSTKHNHGVRLKLNQCPFLGIWSGNGGDFICIEPWQGIADSIDASGKLSEKEGIITLQPGGKFRYNWSAEVY